MGFKADGDAMIALPLGVAFILGRRKPTKRFCLRIWGGSKTWQGVAVVGVIFLSALITAYESINRFYHSQPIHHLGALAVAAIIIVATACYSRDSNSFTGQE